MFCDITETTPIIYTVNGLKAPEQLLVVRSCHPTAEYNYSTQTATGVDFLHLYD